MTIFILDNDPAECAEMLDDKSLDKMIRDIAQVLCNVHYDLLRERINENLESGFYAIESDGINEFDDLRSKFPLNCPIKAFNHNSNMIKWTQWARECRANYEYFVTLLFHCYKEMLDRQLDFGMYEIWKIYEFVRDNVPNLGGMHCKCEGQFICDHCHYQTPLPLVMPAKYIIKHLSGSYEYLTDEIDSYRNWYKAKLQQRGKACSYYPHETSKVCINCGDRSCYKDYNPPVWTRRGVPEFLKNHL